MSRPMLAIIVGGGPGGLATAVALQQVGIEPLVIEHAVDSRELGSGLTLWPNAMAALRWLDLADRVAARSRPLAAIEMRSWRGERLFHVALPLDGENESGFALHRGELVDVLRNALCSSAVLTGRRCVGFEQDETGVTAVLEDGATRRGDVLIGADGLRSTIRTQLFGEAPPRFAGYTVWRGIACFNLAEPMGVTSLGQGSQFGMFPLSGERVYWFASANVRDLEPETASREQVALLGRFGIWHDPIPAVIASTPRSAILRNNAFDRDPDRPWGLKRVTLLGDAAHAATPTLGQGACQAIEDAVVLARCLSTVTDPKDALAAYETRRFARTSAITRQSRMIGRVGQWEHPLACRLRNRLIAATPRQARLRQLARLHQFHE